MKMIGHRDVSTNSDSELVPSSASVGLERSECDIQVSNLLPMYRANRYEVQGRIVRLKDLLKSRRTTFDLHELLRLTRPPLHLHYAHVQTRGAASRFLTGTTCVFGCDGSSRGAGTMNVPAPHSEKQMITIASFSIRFTGELQSVA